MNNQRLISFDIQADFGFFKKPDYNDGVLLTYNMLHKPALLGILGAIIGLRGYRKKGEWPEYYQRLAALLVAPLFKKAKRCKSLNFKEVWGFFFSKSKQN